MQALLYGVAWASWVCKFFCLSYIYVTSIVNSSPAWLLMCVKMKNQALFSIFAIVILFHKLIRIIFQVPYVSASFGVIYVLVKPSVSYSAWDIIDFLLIISANLAIKSV